MLFTRTHRSTKKDTKTTCTHKSDELHAQHDVSPLRRSERNLLRFPLCKHRRHRNRDDAFLSSALDVIPISWHRAICICSISAVPSYTRTVFVYTHRGATASSDTPRRRHSFSNRQKLLVYGTKSSASGANVCAATPSLFLLLARRAVRRGGAVPRAEWDILKDRTTRSYSVLLTGFTSSSSASTSSGASVWRSTPCFSRNAR